MDTPRAQDFNLPVNTNKLGCIMLEFNRLPVRSWFTLQDIEAGSVRFVYDQTGEQPWVKGPVAEKGSHVTLLYGLVDLEIRNANHRLAGQAYKETVDELLAGLDLVDGRYRISDLDVFENPAYDVVVGRVSSTVLNEANRRLRYLPHVDTFADYKAHVTLAYVEKGTGGIFADAIWHQALNSSELVGKAINYGGETII